MEAQEIWKPVVDYEGLYECSNLGRVRSLPRKGTKGGLLKPQPTTNGDYLQVKLSKNGEESMRGVHTLVMRAFVGECPEGYEVDHYDWNPSNNRLENLSYQLKGVNRARRSPEWKKNQAEAMQKLAQDPEWRKKQAEAVRKSNSKPVNQYTLDREYVKTWPSTREAARELGLSQGSISQCCNDKYKSAGGFIWRFSD